jgi:hypothetical protein
MSESRQLHIITSMAINFHYLYLFAKCIQFLCSFLIKEGNTILFFISANYLNKISKILLACKQAINQIN